MRLRARRSPEEWTDRGHTELCDLEAAGIADLPRVVRYPSGTEEPLRASNVSAEGGLVGCLACGHPELYVQKDFPRTVGLILVVVAAVLAPFTWYLSLLVAAVLDALLYYTAPDVVLCYVCASEHRGFPQTPRHPRFDREIDERLRYGKKAVMGRPMRDGGTAGAPEPEH